MIGCCDYCRNNGAFPHSGSALSQHVLKSFTLIYKKSNFLYFQNSVHNNPVFGALLGNSALGVEIFLVLSGLLGARSWLRKADQPFFAHYRAFIIRRVLRLAPSIVFFVYIAAGPVTKHFLPR